MDHYAGIDVSLKESSVCVVDADGRIVRLAAFYYGQFDGLLPPLIALYDVSESGIWRVSAVPFGLPLPIPSA